MPSRENGNKFAPCNLNIDMNTANKTATAPVGAVFHEVEKNAKKSLKKVLTFELGRAIIREV